MKLNHITLGGLYENQGSEIINHQDAGGVNFYNGGTFLGTSNLSGGVAAFSASLLSGGERIIIATYRGNDNFIASNSPTLAQIIGGHKLYLPLVMR